MPKEGCYYVCLSVILIASIFKMDKNYYPEVFSEKCKYIVKEKKNYKFLLKSMIILMILIMKRDR